MLDFVSIFKDFELPDLLKIRNMLNESINIARDQFREIVQSKNINDYIKYTPNFINDHVESEGILADICTLNVKCDAKQVGTKWLTTTNKPYVWYTSGGKAQTKEPHDISNYQFINNLMNRLNNQYNLGFNSCLISVLNDDRSSLRLHNDNETSMDCSHPICVATLGDTRTVDFLNCVQVSSEPPKLSLTPQRGSIYFMQPGCQTYFKHRILADKSPKTCRYSLSFRRMVVPSSGTMGFTSTTAAPTPSQNVNSVNKANDNVHSGIGHVTSPTNAVKHKKKLTTVIFGTSITSRLIGKKISRGGRPCINISQSGARIGHIGDMIDDFYVNHPAAGDIEKVILSFGTNDIKHSSKGVRHLRNLVSDLIYKVRSYFPDSTIIIQSCLPIRAMYQYTISNVLNFNKILIELCTTLKCMYLDCFRDFLTPDGRFQNRTLFHDWLHLNKRGLCILAGWYKYVINIDSFNPIIGNFS